MHHRPLIAAGHLALLAAAALSLGACASQDRHVFHSTVSMPMTVAVYEPYSDQTLWSKDIPVHFKLQIDLDRNDNDNEIFGTDTMPARKMTAKLYPEDGKPSEAVETAEVKLPGNPVMLKVTLRPAPEYPKEPEPAPAKPTAAATKAPATGAAPGTDAPAASTPTAAPPGIVVPADDNPPRQPAPANKPDDATKPNDAPKGDAPKADAPKANAPKNDDK